MSPADTTTIQPLPGATWYRRPIAASDVFAAVGRVSARKPWQRPVVRARETDRDSTRKPEPESKSDDATETPDHRTPAGRSGGAR
ncbi:hypothetical protein [Halovenus amylolytica]|uniref:hypothetical protein n=1 Tax=Halovenus amylolytica TaxID=2500550 RepID=UPI003D6B9D40